MTQLAITVEGDTEENFVKGLPVSLRLASALAILYARASQGERLLDAKPLAEAR